MQVSDPLAARSGEGRRSRSILSGADRSLLFQHYTGRRPNKRILELIHFYLMGWVDSDELVALLQKQ